MTDLKLPSIAASYGDGMEKIELAVTLPQDRAEWLKSRKKGIGGSDMAAVCGVDPYRSPLDVYLDKTGEREGPDGAHLRRGRKLESLIAAEYIERHPEVTLSATSTLRHPQHDWMLGHPDRIIASPHRSKDGLGVLEIKAPSRAVYEQIRLNGIPPHYQLQMQHYLAVTGHQWGTFAIFCADKWEMLLVEVERDEGLITRIIEIGETFWKEYVEKGIPPKDESYDIELPAVTGTLIKRADPEFAEAVTTYRDATELAKQAEALKETARLKIVEAVGDAVGVYESDEGRVYYQEQAGRTTFDKKALMALDPQDPREIRKKMTELFAQYPHVPEVNDVLSSLAYSLDTGLFGIDWPSFEKKSKNFRTVRVYPHKEK